MRIRTMLFRLSAVAALALAFAISARAMPAQATDSEEISKLLVEAKSHAVQAEDDAAELYAYTRSKLSWGSHGFRLEQMREHVNALGTVSKQLTDLRQQGSPWQQKAIDQIDPLLREMASALTATINHLNKNQSRIHTQAYSDYVQASYNLAKKTAGMIQDFVEYDQAQSKAASLEANLNLAASDKSEK